MSTTTATAPASRCSTSTSPIRRWWLGCPINSASSWRDVRAGPDITGPFLAGLTTVLGPADGHSAAAARQRVWSALIADATPYNLGAKARSAAAELPWSIVEIGLSSVAPQPPPS